MSNRLELKAGVQELLGLSDAELETELGRRLGQTKEEFEGDETFSATRAVGLTVDRETLQSLPDFARKTAERFLRRFEREMYSLICVGSDPDHKKIRSAAEQGLAALGYAISGALVVSFGWLPGIATVVAVIIAQRALNSGYQTFCDTWKERF